MMRVELVPSQDTISWDEYIARCPGSCAFHSSEWKRALSATFPQYRRDDHFLRCDGGVVGAWSAFVFAPFPFIAFSEASPWNLFGGYVGPDEAPDPSLYVGSLAAWETEAGRRGRCALSLTPPPWQYEALEAACLDAGFAPVDPKSTHLLPLPNDPKALWESYKGSVRTDVRRAQNARVTVEPVTEGPRVTDFYAIYASTMDRFGSLAKPLSLVERLAAGSIGRLLVALHDGQVIAGLLYLHFGLTTTIWMAASEPSERRYSPNHLLYHTALTEAIAARSRVADFGASPQGNEGLIRFKESFGATPARFGTLRKVIAPIRMRAWKLAYPGLRRLYRIAQRWIG